MVAGGHSNPVIPSANAVAFCLLPPQAATSCTGDSGSGVVTSTGTRTLLGVVDAGPSGCVAGGATIVAYVGAPEILRFIQGDDHPPVAPRRTTATVADLSWRGQLRVGGTLTCTSSGWDGAPTLSFAFLNAQNGQVLQQGTKGTYVLRAADVGDTIACQALATNDGGTAVLSTPASAAVGPAAPVAIAPVAPVAAVRGKAVTARVVLSAPGVTGKFAVCVTPPAQVAGRVCTSLRVDSPSNGPVPFTLRLKIKSAAPLGTSKMTITALAGTSSGRKTALLRVTRGGPLSRGRLLARPRPP